MCGIAGYFLRERRAFASERVESLLRPIRARGPDDEGVFCALRGEGGARRLATERTIAALPFEARKMAEVDALNVRAYLEGKTPPNLVPEQRT